MRHSHGDCSQYVGQRQGSLVVTSVTASLYRTSSRGSNKTYPKYRLECVCDCGVKFSVTPISFVEGRVSSCRHCRLRSSYRGYIGKSYGRLVVDEILEDTGQGVLATCTCTCGVQRVYLLKRILNGRVKSCGCLKVDVARDKIVSDGYLGNILRVRNSSTVPNVTNKLGYKNIYHPTGSNKFRVSVTRKGETLARDVDTLGEALALREEFLEYFRGKYGV